MADILVFGAHPDDAEFGMGASLVKFVRSGLSVTVCVLTRGEAGTYGTAEGREAEMKAAAAKLGGALEILSFKDCQVFDTFEARVALAEVIRRHRPRLVFAPSPVNPAFHKDGASHPDHMATGQVTRAALRYARFAGLKEVRGEPWDAAHLLYYMVPRTRRPTFVNDVTPYMDEWETIARCHESQMAIRGGRIMHSLRRFRETYGTLIGVAYGEAFLSEEPLVFDAAALLATTPQPGTVPPA
jgi:N-acetylglucosamine malate deacetylase 1